MQPFQKNLLGHRMELYLNARKSEPDLRVQDKVNEIQNLIKQNKRPVNLKQGKSKNSYFRVIFHGPAGNGKKLAAVLLGKELGKEVFRIDSSKLVSRYIGETEKNLSEIMDNAQQNDGILFFDEADALFGKRTQITDSNDRYANQILSHVRQIIEDYDGMIILSCTSLADMDKAMIRSFDKAIPFLHKKTQKL